MGIPKMNKAYLTPLILALSCCADTEAPSAPEQSAPRPTGEHLIAVPPEGWLRTSQTDTVGLRMTEHCLQNLRSK